jgi:hypothetical protein
MKNRFKLNFFLVFTVLMVINHIFCHNKESHEEYTMPEHIEESLQKIQTMRIFFGHRSVGNNVLQGLEDILLKFSDIHMNIVNWENTSDLPEYYLAHYSIGENGKPFSKCSAFLERMPIIVKNKADIAFFKFCFVDIDEKSDIEEIFDYYQKTILEIRDKYPELTIIHVTVPLMVESGGIKKKIKRMIGVKDGFDASNIKRNEFNRLLLEHYKEEPIFDLATIESTYPDGSRASFRVKDVLYYELALKYTDDGGHLNALGRKMAAYGLIEILAQING